MRTYNIQSIGYTKDNLLKVEHQVIESENAVTAIKQHIQDFQHTDITRIFISRHKGTEHQSDEAERELEPDSIVISNIGFDPAGGEL